MDVKSLIVLFVEDRPGTRSAIDGFMMGYAFVREYASSYEEFLQMFPVVKPHAVVLDYDLPGGAYHSEVYTIVEQEKMKSSRHIELIGVTAQDPFENIKKILKATGFKKIFYNDGTEEFYLDLIAEFHKTLDKINEK